MEIKHIVEGDKYDIAVSDIVLAFVWKPSVGTSMEIMQAFGTGKIVLVVCPDIGTLSPWIRYHSTHVFESMTGAITWLKELNG